MGKIRLHLNSSVSRGRADSCAWHSNMKVPTDPVSGTLYKVGFFLHDIITVHGSTCVNFYLS